jgi:hypothetical protein
VAELRRSNPGAPEALWVERLGRGDGRGNCGGCYRFAPDLAIERIPGLQDATGRAVAGMAQLLRACRYSLTGCAARPIHVDDDLKPRKSESSFEHLDDFSSGIGLLRNEARALRQTRPEWC